MSFFLGGALLALGFSLLHAASMVLAFSGWAQQRVDRWAAVPVAHLAAALLVGPLLPVLSTVASQTGSVLCLLVSMRMLWCYPEKMRRSWSVSAMHYNQAVRVAYSASSCCRAQDCV